MGYTIRTEKFVTYKFGI